MERKLILLILLWIFWIVFLICSCVQAQQSDSADETINEKSFSLKFQRTKVMERYRFCADGCYDEGFTIPIQVGSENTTFPLLISTRTSITWITNDFLYERNHTRLSCSKSKSCQSEEAQKFSLKDYWKPTASGMLFKEQVSFGGLTFPNCDVFITDDGRYWELYGMFGLDFQRANPKVPTIYEFLQTEGLIDEPIAYMNFQNHNEGDLTFGRYPANKTRADFKFVPVHSEKDNLHDGFSVPISGIGYKDITFERQHARLDFHSPFISLPDELYNQINYIIHEKGLKISDHQSEPVSWTHPEGYCMVKCSAKKILNDLIVEFEGFSLRIPPSAYIIPIKEFSLKVKDLDEEVCFLALLFQGWTRTDTILGQPFFKTYDVIFDSWNNSIGFSQIYIPPIWEKLMLYIITIGLVSFILLEFLLSSLIQKFRKIVGRPLQIFPHQTVNLQPDEENQELIHEGIN